MELNDVLKVLEEYHYQDTGKIEGTHSKYKVFENPHREEKVYLGSYFIEIETCSHAYPWKDKISTIDELKTFLV